MKNIRRNLLLAVAALLATFNAVPSGHAASPATSNTQAITQNADEALTQATFKQGSFASKSPPPGPTKLQPASYFKEKYAAYAKEQAAEAALAASNHAAQSTAPAPTPEATVQFYTGKPFDNDTGTYLFRFRNYNPATASWTTPDPSGFPDGPNNMRYAPVPTTGVDPLGLMTLGGNTSGQVTMAVDPTLPGWKYSRSNISNTEMDASVASQITAMASTAFGGTVTFSSTNLGVSYNFTTYSNYNVAAVYPPGTSGFAPQVAQGGLQIIGDIGSTWAGSGTIGLIQIVLSNTTPATSPTAWGGSVDDKKFFWDGSSSSSPFYNPSSSTQLYDTPYASVPLSGGDVKFTAYDFLAVYDGVSNNLNIYPDGFEYGFRVYE